MGGLGGLLPGTGGFIEEVPGPDEAQQHNERRRYYRITAEGREALGVEAEALESSARMARVALKTDAAS